MRLPLDLAIASHSSQTSSPAPLLAFDHGSGELILVELQGHLELSLDGIEMQDSSVASSSTQSDGAKAGQKVGKLDLSVPSRPTLLIGHHRLIGKLVTLNNPMAILKHQLTVRAQDPSSIMSDMLPPPTSSPLKPSISHEPHSNADQIRSSPPAAQVEGHAGVVEDPPTKRQATHSLGASLATPAPLHRISAGHHANVASSPLAVPSSAMSGTLSTPQTTSQLPQTPLNVSELKRGSHQIVGIIKQKVVFSKRPEPVVNLANEDDSGGEDA